MAEERREYIEYFGYGASSWESNVKRTDRNDQINRKIAIKKDARQIAENLSVTPFIYLFAPAPRDPCPKFIFEFISRAKCKCKNSRFQKYNIFMLILFLFLFFLFFGFVLNAAIRTRRGCPTPRCRNCYIPRTTSTRYYRSVAIADVDRAPLIDIT